MSLCVTVSVPQTQTVDRRRGVKEGKVGWVLSVPRDTGRLSVINATYQYPELVSGFPPKTRKFKWLVKVGASIVSTP